MEKLIPERSVNDAQSTPIVNKLWYGYPQLRFWRPELRFPLCYGRLYAL